MVGGGALSVGVPLDWTTPAPYVLEVRRALAQLLLVIVVSVWRAMPPWLLLLKTGFGREELRGSIPHTGPRANRLPRVDGGCDPAEVCHMKPLESADLEGDAVARRPCRGSR